MTAPGRTAPRRAELLEVATALFHEKGYAHTTLQDIADRMGFTKAAVYYYAKNKEDLLVEIYTAIVVPAIATAKQIAAAPAADGATKFLALIEEHLRTFLRNVQANAVFDVQHFSLSDPAKRRIQALRREYTTILRKVYEAGIADGSIRPGDSGIAVNAIIAMLNSVHRWYRPRGGLPAEELIRQLLAIVADGVRATGTRQRR